MKWNESMIAHTTDVYVHNGASGAEVPDFPAMPNLAAEHIAAVRRHLNGGRTTAELEDQARFRLGTPVRFTSSDIRSIRTRYARGETQLSIAIDYGVGQSSICRICRRESYRGVA